MSKALLTVQNTVQVPVEKVWIYWADPAHVVNWNNASEDWHTPKAVNDLRVGGRFVYTMAAKDESFSFDFSGTYDEVIPHQRIAYTLDDDRKVTIVFTSTSQATQITQSFEAEDENSLELQQHGWQAILDNFKRYTEQ
jgi:uncharacterized protein YndB with AHSA1/START domain